MTGGEKRARIATQHRALPGVAKLLLEGTSTLTHSKMGGFYRQRAKGKTLLSFVLRSFISSLNLPGTTDFKVNFFFFFKRFIYLSNNLYAQHGA